MGCFKVVGEPCIGGVIPKRSPEPLSGRAPFRGEPANRYPVASDDDGLAALDLVKDVREVPCRLRGRDSNHEYTVSDLI